MKSRLSTRATRPRRLSQEQIECQKNLNSPLTTNVGSANQLSQRENSGEETDFLGIANPAGTTGNPELGTQDLYLMNICVGSKVRVV